MIHDMNLGRSDRAKTVLVFALAGIIAAALLSRMDFLVLRGGLQADQLAWANKFYFGGITKGYLAIRDSILSWTPEARPWPYLPGYSAFLAMLYEVGAKDLALVRFVQLAADSLAVVPLYVVLHRIGGSAPHALMGCMIYAIAPWWSAGATYLLGESLVSALMLVVLAGMVVVRDRAGGPGQWFLLGLLASILPFFRSDMILLFGPLAIWALLAAPERRRWISAACVVAGFALPLFLWAARNDYIHGQFMLTPPAKWYAAWSGLGQVANDFGYFVDDQRASRLLASKGIGFNTAQSESYWFGEYLSAWVSHPAHVMRAILYRFGRILGQPDTESFAPRLARAAYPAMAFITAIALIWLLRMRRWADAFLIALPMMYALGSLGPLYVELRYVRYAGLTYLLVLPIVLGKVVDVMTAGWPRRYRPSDPQYLRSMIGVAGVVVVAAGAAFQLASTTRAAQSQGLIERLDLGSSPLPASRTLDDVGFRPAAPDVQTARDAVGLHLRAKANSGAYLLMAPMGAQANGGAIIRYRVTLLQGVIGFGVLSADSRRWLSYEPLSGDPGREVEGTFISMVEPGSQFVIDTQGGTVEAVATKLEWTLVCARPAGLFRLLFDRTPVPASPCVSQG
jgi:hypothetical protein